MKRKVGDIVRKKEGAGFVGESLIIRLLDLDEDYPPYEEWCFLDCKNPDCKEWVNCEVIRDGKRTGEYVYHVSECEMEDL